MLVAAVLLAADTLYLVDYEMAARVARLPQDESAVYSPRIETLEAKGRPYVRVQDDLATFEWQVFDSSFDVRVTNEARGEGGESFVVLWDRAELVDFHGRTHALAPTFSSGNPSGNIARGKKRVYQLRPVYDPGQRTLFGSPQEGRVGTSPQEILDLYAGQVGRGFLVRLPIQVGARDYRYEFDLRVGKVLARVMPKERF